MTISTGSRMRSSRFHPCWRPQSFRSATTLSKSSTPYRARSRSRSAKNRYGNKHRSRCVNPITWEEICRESGPGGFYIKIEPPNVNSPLVKTSENGFDSLEPESVKILPKKDLEELEKFNGVRNSCAKTNDIEAPHTIAARKFVKGSGLLIPYQVDDQRCWAIVDTGASNSLIRSTLATELGNEIVPNQSSLIGPVGNVMSTKGLMKAMVKIGDLVAEDEFVVVDGLYPGVRMGLKFMIESKIYPNFVSQELVI